jgi:hypothetical protein
MSHNMYCRFDKLELIQFIVISTFKKTVIQRNIIQYILYFEFIIIFLLKKTC